MASVEWETPQDFFDTLNAEFGFTLDVCAAPETAKCEKFFTIHNNGLFQTWKGVCWMNPPYNKDIGRWVGKAYESARELDALLLELDSQFPDGEWESALERVTIPQEHWESLKVPYCEYDVHLSIGGTGYAIFYWNCIERENRNRIGHLESFACMLLEFKCQGE